MPYVYTAAYFYTFAAATLQLWMWEHVNTTNNLAMKIAATFYPYTYLLRAVPSKTDFNFMTI